MKLPAIGDTVVVMGIVDRVDKDGLVLVKLLDRTLGPGAEYVSKLAFWHGAVFPVVDSIAVVSDAAKGKRKRK